MKISKKILVLLLVPILFLTACGGSAITTKSSLIEQTKDFKVSINKQDKLLSSLTKEIYSNQDSFRKLSKKDAYEGITAELEDRKEMLAKLTDEVKLQANITENFNKTIKQDSKNFPIDELKSLTQSEEIIQMDSTTFNQYLDKATNLEKTIGDSFGKEDYNQDQLDTDVALLNQYYGSLSQQLEIWQVNVARVKQNTNNLLKMLN